MNASWWNHKSIHWFSGWQTTQQIVCFNFTRWNLRFGFTPYRMHRKVSVLGAQHQQLCSFSIVFFFSGTDPKYLYNLYTYIINSLQALPRFLSSVFLVLRISQGKFLVISHLRKPITAPNYWDTKILYNKGLFYSILNLNYTLFKTGYNLMKT